MMLFESGSSLVASLLLALFSSESSHAWVTNPTTTSIRSKNYLAKFSQTTKSTISSTSLNVIPATAASLLAGSIAGALGVGIAYPLDTIKTKSQVLSAALVSQSGSTKKAALASSPARTVEIAVVEEIAFVETKPLLVNFDDSPKLVDFDRKPQTQLVDFDRKPQTQLVDFDNKKHPLVEFDIVDVSASGVALVSTASAAVIPLPAAGASMMEVSDYIYQTSGIGGFFGGVQTSMAGQAIIKAVVFAVNAAVLQYSKTNHLFNDDTTIQLLTAAATAGFCTSFLAAPVDRIKILMQCSEHDCYNGDEGECVQAVLDQEGWRGFLTRGLGTTMLREVPAYALYFGVYGGLQAYCTDLTAVLGPTLSPALYGAAAGCACWLPIYPIDVIRTVALNTEGDDMCPTDPYATTGTSQSAWEVAVDLYENGGISAFWDGLGARMLRQAVNHAVTFSVYDWLMHAILLPQPDVFA